MSVELKACRVFRVFSTWEVLGPSGEMSPFKNIKYHILYIYEEYLNL